MKKTLVSALTTALVVGAASTTFAAANPFSDVAADHWAYDAVSKLASEGVISGYTDGSYAGNSTMTRYEMAQIVAKAMAKQDKVNASQKAMLDKLAAEFSDELASLGVRVAALEAKTDNVKWTGWARYDIQKTVREDGQDETTQRSYLRLEPVITINDNWKVFGRFSANANMKNNKSADVEFGHVYAQGNYDKFTVKLGKVNTFGNESHGFVMDSAFSGVEVDFGNVVQATVRAGRLDAKHDAEDVHTGSDYANVGVRYVGSKLDAGVAYSEIAGGNLSNNPAVTGKDKVKIVDAGLGYKFSDKWYASADYAQASGDVTDAQKKNGRIAVKYGKQDISVPGSFDVTLSYGKRSGESINAYGNTGDWHKGNDKGWSLVSVITLDKNIKTELAYFKGENVDNKKDQSVFWGQLQFAF